MSGELTIRACRPEDVETVVDITLRAFVPVSVDAMIEQVAGPLQGTTWQDRKGADVRGEIERNPEGCFVAEADGQVVGFITTQVRPEWGLGRIPNLGVDPRYHGRGTGKALLRHAFTYFNSLGLTAFRIETTENNAVGQALYPRFGFVEMTRQIQYFMTADQAAASELGAEIFGTEGQK
jgi:ribosomal protein S18 acetylase RimI-like enzyme